MTILTNAFIFAGLGLTCLPEISVGTAITFLLVHVLLYFVKKVMILMDVK